MINLHDYQVFQQVSDDLDKGIIPLEFYQSWIDKASEQKVILTHSNNKIRIYKIFPYLKSCPKDILLIYSHVKPDGKILKPEYIEQIDNMLSNFAFYEFNQADLVIFYTASKIAFRLLMKIADDHPFSDGNKRTAVLSAFNLFSDLMGVDLTVSSENQRKMAISIHAYYESHRNKPTTEELYMIFYHILVESVEFVSYEG